MANANLIWQMRDGTYIRIQDMTNAHLTNTIRMLRRNMSVALSSMERLWPSDTAIDHCLKSELITPPILYDLEAEALKRGLEHHD